MFYEFRCHLNGNCLPFLYLTNLPTELSNLPIYIRKCGGSAIRSRCCLFILDVVSRYVPDIAFLKEPYIEAELSCPNELRLLKDLKVRIFKTFPFSVRAWGRSVG